MIVVDTNAIAYFFIVGDRSDAARRLFRKDPEWVAPVLWRSEFRNMLAGSFRRGHLSFDNACVLQREAEQMLDGAEYSVESDDVLMLVRDSNCSAYDCEFVALALRLRTHLVTADNQLLQSYPGVATPLT